MRERELWTYHCPECGEGFGDLEGDIIKRKCDGFGDRYTLLKCPRCNVLIVTGPYGCVEFEDPEWWDLTVEEKVSK